MKSFLVRKQGISNKEADQALEIPPDFDYVELPSSLKSLSVSLNVHWSLSLMVNVADMRFPGDLISRSMRWTSLTGRESDLVTNRE